MEWILRNLNASRGGQQSWDKGWKECLTGEAETLGLSSLEKRRPRGGFTFAVLCGSLRRESAEAGAGPCSPVTKHRTRGNSTKLCQERVRLDARTSLVTVRVVKHQTGFRERQSMLHACQGPRGSWLMPSVTRLYFWSVLEWSGSGTWRFL